MYPIQRHILSNTLPDYLRPFKCPRDLEEVPMLSVIAKQASVFVLERLVIVAEWRDVLVVGCACVGAEIFVRLAGVEHVGCWLEGFVWVGGFRRRWRRGSWGRRCSAIHRCGLDRSILAQRMQRRLSEQQRCLMHPSMSWLELLAGCLFAALLPSTPPRTAPRMLAKASRAAPRKLAWVVPRSVALVIFHR